jgi:hypothetical protein
MAHYAWLDENNIVVNVTVGVDENVIQLGVGGSTEAWETFYSQATGYNIKRTSYNNNIRFNYAGIGFTYDEVRDGFIPPKCHDEATINDLCLWDCTNKAHDPIL